MCREGRDRGWKRGCGREGGGGEQKNTRDRRKRIRGAAYFLPVSPKFKAVLFTGPGELMPGHISNHRALSQIKRRFKPVGTVK
jgi:hypothetical protein